MSLPRTPLRTRNTSSSSSSSKAPSTPTTATKRRNVDSPSTSKLKAPTSGGASPQVRAALAAMRNKQTRAPTASTSSALNEPDQPDAFSTPVPRRTASSDRSEEFEFGKKIVALPVVRNRTSGGPNDPVQAEDRDDVEHEEEEVVLDWGSGGKSTSDLIEGAKRTGKLNIASRELKSIPAQVYDALMSRSSTYHPSRQRKSRLSDLKNGKVDIDFESIYLEETTSWYEQRELKELNIANNEIELVEEMIAGFEELEVLDLHNNYLTTIPLSIGHLTNLTSLNLSSNQLTEFPVQILALTFLTHLNLSSNRLTHLWPVDWRAHLSDTLKPPTSSPTATPESPDQEASSALGFWNPLPTKAARNRPRASEVEFTAAPFPRLLELNLSDNPFEEGVFGDEGWSLPAKLKELLVADTGLVEGAFKAEVFGRLEALEILRFAGSNILDGLFSTTPIAEDEDRLFRNVKQIDLSRNSIDSLEHLESFLHKHVERPIEYVGLEKPIFNLIKASPVLKGLTGSPLQIVLHDNPMRNEQLRRRSAFPSLARVDSNPSPVSTPAKSTSPTPRTSFESISTPQRRKEQWEIDAENGVLTEGGKRRARLEAIRRAREEEELERIAEASGRDERPEDKSADDGIVNSLFGLNLQDEKKESNSACREVEVEEAVAQETATRTSPPRAVSLVSESPDVPSAVTQTNREASKDDPAVVLVSSAFNAASVTIDLSSKSLSTLVTPSSGSAPNYLASPRALILSRNSFTNLPLEALSVWTWTASIRVLDLTLNQISSLSELDNGIILPNLTDLNLSHNCLTSLEFVSNFAPNLSTLDVSRNQLASDNGLDGLLNPSEPGRSGLTSLNLRGNKLSSLESLIRVATFLQGEPSKSYRLAHLDLRDNEIARVDPLLGWLPYGVEIWLAGNRFRIPKREIYDHAMGAREIVNWLRDRC